jgi:uncharacterized protein
MSDPGDSSLFYLQESGCDPGVIAHCIVVRDVAVSIADRIIARGRIRVDRELVAAGAILHDIGRSESHGMDHADLGGAICRQIGQPESLCRIVERHIGAGLTHEERIGFGLSGGDRIPETIEEKIVAHADNLVKRTRIITRSEFNRELRKYPEPVQTRFTALADELEFLAGSSLP